MLANAKKRSSRRRSNARAKSEPRRLRIALIGAGGIADMHLQNLVGMSDVEIVALADINHQSMLRYAGKYNIPDDCLFADYGKMLRAIEPDAVSVCTPNGLHAPATIAALNAGAHVLVEKPLALNAREGKRMLDAARKNRRKLVIGFQNRYTATARFFKQAADEGQFGDILYARVQALRRRGIPNWGVFVRKDMQGGGPLIDIGVHMLEVTHYVMGAPKPVAAVGSTFTYLGNQPSDRIESQWKGWDYRNHNIEDLAVGQIRFANGAVLTIEAAFVAHIEKNEMTFQLIGSEGGCAWSPPTIFRDEAGHMVNKTPGWLAPSGFGDMFAAKMRGFVDHVLHDKPTLAPGEDGLMIQKMLDAIYRSAERGGREVRIT